jgi:hypothetical protein
MIKRNLLGLFGNRKRIIKRNETIDVNESQRSQENSRIRQDS